MLTSYILVVCQENSILLISMFFSNYHKISTHTVLCIILRFFFLYLNSAGCCFNRHSIISSNFAKTLYNRPRYSTFYKTKQDVIFGRIKQSNVTLRITGKFCVISSARWIQRTPQICCYYTTFWSLKFAKDSSRGSSISYQTPNCRSFPLQRYINR